MENMMLLLFSFLLGLFPAVFLVVLQIIMLVMLGWLVWQFRRLNLSHVRGLLTWPNVALWQFFVFFLINALVFMPLEGTPAHFRSVSIESWGATLACSVVVMLFVALQSPERIKQGLIGGLPVGLSVTFLVASVLYLFEEQGARIQLWTPNPLVPPLWFLVLTMVSFVWFPTMSARQQAFRLAVFVMAGLMTVYTGARLVMIAWLVSAVLMGCYFYALSPPARRRMAFAAATSVPVLGLALVVGADYLAGGHFLERFRYLVDGSINQDTLSSLFPRFILWNASVDVIADGLPWGHGQINERILIQEQIGWDRWLRAHQTYLSYLVAGGVPALVSGLVFQLPIVKFLQRARIRSTFPAFIGLGVVLTMNCLTDSVFQSVVSVQLYAVLLLLLLRATQQDARA